MKEIQQALTAHGYPVEPSGVLDVSTVEALRGFQGQQKLESTGKLNSLTLIGLGLGPPQQSESPPGYPAKEGNR